MINDSSNEEQVSSETSVICLEIRGNISEDERKITEFPWKAEDVCLLS